MPFLTTSKSLSGIQLTYILIFVTSGTIAMYYKYLWKSQYDPKSSPGLTRHENIIRGFNLSRNEFAGLDWCPNMYKPQFVHKQKGIWQAQRLTETDNPEDLAFAIHAYYDDRPILNNSHFIRIFLVMPHSSFRVLRKSPVGYLWFNHSLQPIRIKASFQSIDGVATIVDNQRYVHCILSCHVPDRLQYSCTHISFSALHVTNITTYLPLTYLAKSNKFVHTFGHCQANGISFGYLGDDQAKWMVEWIEINKLFGISEFNIYNGTMQVGPQFQKVLDFYQTTGELRIHQQPPPLFHFDPMKRAYAELAMRTAFNDCMYRNMYRYEYVVSVDFDEIIVPKKMNDYFEILNHLRPQLTGQNYSAILFESKAFYQNVLGKPQNVSSDMDLKTMKYVYHVKDGRIKPFINPRLCMVGFSHFCLRRLLGLKQLAGSHTKELALVHHYRNQCFKINTNLDKETCQKIWGRKTVNTKMQDFAGKVFDKIKSVWIHLNLQ